MTGGQHVWMSVMAFFRGVELRDRGLGRRAWAVRYDTILTYRLVPFYSPLYRESSLIFAPLRHVLQKGYICRKLLQASNLFAFQLGFWARFGTVRSEVQILSPRLP